MEKRGGTRLGAGRPRKEERIALSLSLNKELVKRMKSAAEAAGQTYSMFVERAIAKALEEKE